MNRDVKATNGSLALNQSKVVVIQPTQRQEAQKLRVAAYARVSTDSSDQANSFLAQMEHYNRLIAGNENWTLVDVYADRGISGTSAEKRPDFQRMLSDCRQGRIDKILVKSISRFARNTKECLEIVRERKAIGIGVCFEAQNIDTGKVTGELLTSVFAAIAQKESESISQNMRWSYHQRMESGTFLPSSMAYGYRIEDGKIVVVPDRAETVRRIFGEYLSGYGLLEIAKRLNADEVTVDEGSEQVWTCSAVSYILSNERYIGDSLWQKKYATDELPAKKVRNHGERQQYYAMGTQEAIIDKDTFEAVQELRKRRTEHRRVSTAKEADLLRAKLRCGECGSTFRKYSGDGNPYLVCKLHVRDKDSCTVPQIPEKELQNAFLRLYHKLKWHGDDVFTQLTIGKRVKKNTGQLPMYLIQDHHEGIISREMFHAAQAELARRNAGKAPSQKQAPTGRAKYSAKYALSDRLVCGECGSLHRRCVWTHHGQRRIVWRCISRIDYGSRYCHDSPTIDEKPLQDAILAAINSVMSRKEVLIGQIADAMRMELAPNGAGDVSLGDLDRMIEAQEKKFGEMFASVQSNQDFMARADEFRAINEELASLKSKKALLLERQSKDIAANWRVDEAVELLNTGTPALTEWNEGMIRQLVETVKVISKEKLLVTLQGGIQIEQNIGTTTSKTAS